MSAVLESLVTKLRGSTALTSYLGSSTRITPSHLPQNPSLPALTYSTVGGGRTSALTVDTRGAWEVVQLSCWGDRYTEAVGVADRVRNALVRWSSTRVADVFLDQEVDLGFDDATGTYHRALDLRVWYCST